MVLLRFSIKTIITKCKSDEELDSWAAPQIKDIDGINGEISGGENEKGGESRFKSNVVSPFQ